MSMYVPDIKLGEAIDDLPGSPLDFDITPYKLPNFGHDLKPEVAGRLVIPQLRAGHWAFIRGADFIDSLNREIEERENNAKNGSFFPQSALSLGRDFRTYKDARIALFKTVDSMIATGLLVDTENCRTGLAGKQLRPTQRFLNKLRPHRINPDPDETPPGLRLNTDEIMEELYRS